MKRNRLMMAVDVVFADAWCRFSIAVTTATAMWAAYALIRGI